jgi:hypothetical protein
MEACMSCARTLGAPLIVLTTLCSVAPAAWAAWPSDPNVNVPLCTAQGDQHFPASVSDGAGGAIVAWSDRRDTIVTHDDIYVQRVNAAGVPLWTANGLALCTAPGAQVSPAIASDGAGGAIVTWTDARSGGAYDIYAQRVNAAGVPQWTADGVAICTAAGNQALATILSTADGGAILTWSDGRSGAHAVYAQRVDAAGVVQWTPDGVALCTKTHLQTFPQIAADGASGAIIAWQDDRVGPDVDIYAQRVDAAGTPQWTADGVALCTAVGYQQNPAIAEDGAGGAIVTWQDGRAGSDYDIFAQRVSAAGATQWAPNGIAVCSVAGSQFFPTITSDAAGGAIVAWDDGRGGTSYDIYAQRVSTTGVALWTAGGVALCTDPGYESDPKIVSDGAGGAIVAWEDVRDAATTHIFARGVNAAGVAQWAADGVALCTAANGQFSPAIVANGAGGAIVAWDDFRNGTFSDIYAQKINADGTLGDPLAPIGPPLRIAPTFALRGAQPNPSIGDLRVTFTLVSDFPATLELFDPTGRRIESVSVGSLGPGDHLVSLAPGGHAPPPGIYWVRLTQYTHSAFQKVAIIQ